MTSEEWNRLFEVFHTAREKSGCERVMLLDAACGESTLLRKAVEELLREDAAAKGFLSESLFSAFKGEAYASQVVPGQRFGRYTTVEYIGHKSIQFRALLLRAADAYVNVLAGDGPAAARGVLLQLAGLQRGVLTVVCGADASVDGDSHRPTPNATTHDIKRATPVDRAWSPRDSDEHSFAAAIVCTTACASSNVMLTRMVCRMRGLCRCGVFGSTTAGFDCSETCGTF
jgi:hypothetical protein